MTAGLGPLGHFTGPFTTVISFISPSIAAFLFIVCFLGSGIQGSVAPCTMEWTFVQSGEAGVIMA